MHSLLRYLLKRRCHNGLHLRLLGEDGLNQFHLGTAAIQIVIFPVDLVIDVTQQMVHEKADHLLKGDQRARKGQVSAFLRGQETVGLFHKPFDQGLKG